MHVHPQLLALIYRNGQITFNGRPVTKWRARGVGLGPDNDVLFETENRNTSSNCIRTTKWMR